MIFIIDLMIPHNGMISINVFLNSKFVVLKLYAFYIPVFFFFKNKFVL